MEESIKILNLASPEVIVIGDDTYDYEDRDGDIEIIEINSNQRPETSVAGDIKPGSSATSCQKILNRAGPVLRSSLTGRRVFSPTDEILSRGECEALPASTPNSLEEKEREKKTLKQEQPQPSSSKSPEVDALNFEDDSDLSVIEIFPPRSGVAAKAGRFPGLNRFDPNPAFKPRARPAPGVSTPVSAKKAKLAIANANARQQQMKSPAVSSAKKLSKKALKRKSLRDRLERQRLQQRLQLQGQSSGSTDTPKKNTKTTARMNRNSTPRKESLIQQSLRNLCNLGTGTGTSPVSVSTSSGSRSRGSSPRKNRSGKERNSLKRLRHDKNEAFVSTARTTGAGSRFGNARGGGRGRPGLWMGAGPTTRSRDKSNRENVLSSPAGPSNAPSASLQTAWDYKSPEYEEHLWQQQQHQNQLPDSSSSSSMHRVSRNLAYLPPLPFSDSSGVAASASKYNDSWKSSPKAGAGRGRGRGRGGVGTRGGRGVGAGGFKLGPTGYGFDAGVPRNSTFELAPARFSPPPPITYNVDNLFCNAFVNGPSTSTNSAGKKTESSYNPMAMLTNSTEEQQPQEPPKLALSAFGGNLFAPTKIVHKPGTLRPIVIDGSNVAMAHGNNKVFSCRGIRVCVDYFRARGHQTIIAFVPHFKGRRSQTVDMEVLDQLETEGIVKTTPGRMVDGKRISAYDDRFIVQSAAQIGGIIISNDNFRDLYNEEPSWRETIHKRIVQYVWITEDMIMFPDDPLGRGGPRLNEILRF